MEEQKHIYKKGGTMRLGAYECEIAEGTKSAEAYNSTFIAERHNHRSEFNNAYKEQFEKAGMKFAGINPDMGLVEIIELPEHKWYVGTQFLPEYRSTVENPHPLFVNFIKASIK